MSDSVLCHQRDQYRSFVSTITKKSERLVCKHYQRQMHQYRATKKHCVNVHATVLKGKGTCNHRTLDKAAVHYFSTGSN